MTTIRMSLWCNQDEKDNYRGGDGCPVREEGKKGGGGFGMWKKRKGWVSSSLCPVFILYFTFATVLFICFGSPCIHAFRLTFWHFDSNSISYKQLGFKGCRRIMNSCEPSPPRRFTPFIETYTSDKGSIAVHILYYTIDWDMH